MGCCEGVEIGMYDDVGKKENGCSDCDEGRDSLPISFSFPCTVRSLCFGFPSERLVFCFLFPSCSVRGHLHVALPRLSRNALAGRMDGVRGKGLELLFAEAQSGISEMPWLA